MTAGLLDQGAFFVSLFPASPQLCLFVADDVCDFV
jgi:hypothetical protein